MEEAPDICSMGFEKVKRKKEVILEAQRDKKKDHFATLMDTCHRKKMRSWNQKLQKYKGRVVLRGEIVKDDSGANAVFTEQGSSASPMAAAKVMDLIARLPGCDGQAADAVSLYTQVKLEDDPRLLKILKRNVLMFGYVFNDTNGPNHGEIEDPEVPLERNIYGHPLAGIAVGERIRRSFL